MVTGSSYLLGMDDHLRSIAASQHGVFSRAQARAVGLSRGAIDHRLERGRWALVSDQVLRISGAPVTLRAEVMATVLSGGPDAIASAATGLALHNVRDFWLLPATAVVGRRPPRGACAGVRESFRVLDAHRTVVDGIPTATVARALFDDARGRSLRSVARRVDIALASRKVTVAQLETLLGELAERGRPGVAAMREVLDARSASYRAPDEQLDEPLLELLGTAGFPAPSRQIHPPGAPSWIDRVDFAWPDHRLVVETDGGAYHDTPSDREHDERRDRALEQLGWSVVRFNWNDVTYRPTSVIRLLRTALAHTT